MKKIFFILLLGLSCVTMFAQSNYLYVIFREDTSTENQIQHHPWGNYDTLFFRDEPHSFPVIQDKVIRHFEYANICGQPDNPVVVQPVSFLESVEYMDWNSEIMNYSGAQFYEFLDKLRTYDKVYFIDRSEIKDGMMKMYPAKELRANY